GMPLAAFGGRRDLMQLVAPAGPVYQAGTLSGNPLAVTAGITTLKVLQADPTAYDRLETLGALAEDGLRDALSGTGTRGCVNRVGSMLTLFLGIERVSNLSEAVQSDTAAFGRFFGGMLDQGVYLPPSQFEAMFISLAHSEADMERLRTAARTVLAR